MQSVYSAAPADGVKSNRKVHSIFYFEYFRLKFVENYLGERNHTSEHSNHENIRHLIWISSFQKEILLGGLKKLSNTQKKLPHISDLNRFVFVESNSFLTEWVTPQVYEIDFSLFFSLWLIQKKVWLLLKGWTVNMSVCLFVGIFLFLVTCIVIFFGNVFQTYKHSLKIYKHIHSCINKIKKRKKVS